MKVTHAGICHSDALVWKDKFIISDGKTMPAIKALPGLHYPLVLGMMFNGFFCENDLLLLVKN